MTTPVDNLSGAPEDHHNAVDRVQGRVLFCIQDSVKHSHYYGQQRWDHQPLQKMVHPSMVHGNFVTVKLSYQIEVHKKARPLPALLHQLAPFGYIIVAFFSRSDNSSLVVERKNLLQKAQTFQVEEHSFLFDFI